MPRLAFAQSFWDGYDTLEKPVRAGVRKAMGKFQALSAAELNADKGLHLESVGNARDPRMRLLPEDQLEVLQYLAEGFGPEKVYQDVVAVRRPADAPAEPVEDLATVIANTPARIRLVTGPEELQEMLEKPFEAWRVFLHPSQRRVAWSGAASPFLVRAA
ncbi:hypothetical protein OH735_33480 [Streptomyces sp. NBC_01618]|nr:hypothetical protein OH735_33480 [Streptomyces sp. NBC_01618]